MSAFGSIREFFGHLGHNVQAVFRGAGHSNTSDHVPEAGAHPPASFSELRLVDANQFSASVHPSIKPSNQFMPNNTERL
ncbi:hypothetical protein P879_04460 [Paragonimus westermani]|uniref:Uncharacterized protein n=1 Tax=Paragonimus westermani TaxID=34504 RepID=A0A8T0DBK2_9TREM|nr:hypothetical protein P879_04460 [Paragonimus westermani]